MFLRKCLKNDIILDFFRFPVPESGVFSDQTKNQSVPGERLCEIEAAAKTYVKKVKQTRKILKKNNL